MGLFEQLGDLLYNAVYMILYPFISFINMSLNAVIRAFQSLLDLWAALSGLLSSVTTLITAFLGVCFDYAWTSLILLGISIVFILRIYYFLKDVSIFGNKI